jgi:membrane fusion protein (multidrug efflux system)
MKVLRTLLIVIGILAVILLPKFFCGEPKAGDAQKMGPKGPVNVGVFEVGGEALFQDYQLSGSLLANEQIDLKAETQGLIQKIYFTEGGKVSNGQLLLKLNDTDFKTQLAKALANKRLLEDNAKRNEILLKKEAIAQADYDLALTELSAIEADVAYLQEQIRKTELKAPFSGTIGLRQVSQGAYITPTTAIATLQDAAKIKVEFSVPEKYSSKIKVGDQIQFTVNNSTKTYSAKVYARDAALSAQTRAIGMRAICENTNGELIPGLFANIKLNFPSQKNAHLIPTQAVIPILKGQKVFVVRGDSAVEVKVNTGFRSEDKIEITEGLQTGDQVIVDGIMYVKNGAKIKINKRK